MHIAKKIAYTLVLIGGLNWGLFGAFSYDLVEVTLGSFPMLAYIVYVLIGLSALFLIFSIQRNKKCSCTKDECQCSIEVKTETK